MNHIHALDGAAFAQIKQKATNVEVIKTSRFIQPNDTVYFQETDGKGNLTGNEIEVIVILSVASSNRPGIAKDHTLLSWDPELIEELATKMPEASKPAGKGTKAVHTETGAGPSTTLVAQRTGRAPRKPKTVAGATGATPTPTPATTPEPKVDPVVNADNTGTSGTDDKAGTIIPDENLF